MFFQDLTPFTYSRAVCSGHVLNIGWLSRDVQFPTGDTKDEFLRTLKLLAENPVKTCAGQHECEFCDFRRIQIPAGNGEIHVPAADRTVTYAAPQSCRTMWKHTGISRRRSSLKPCLRSARRKCRGKPSVLSGRAATAAGWTMEAVALLSGWCPGGNLFPTRVVNCTGSLAKKTGRNSENRHVA